MANTSVRARPRPPSRGFEARWRFGLRGALLALALLGAGPVGDDAPSRLELLVHKAVRGSDAAVAELAGLEDHAEVLVLMQDELRDPNPALRASAVDVLGRIRGERAFDRLVEELEDPHPAVRVSAVVALARIGGPRALEPLLQALADDHSEVRGVAAEKLGELGDARATDPLVDALTAADSGVRFVVSQALQALGDPLGQLVYESLRGFPEATAELARRRDPRALPPLEAALGNWDASVREAAARALGTIADPSAQVPLVEALSDWEWRVRDAAAWALGELGDARAAVPLRRRLRDPHEKVRQSAAWALARVGDEHAAGLLVDLLDDPHGIVRSIAAYALAELGAKHAAPRLSDLLVRDRLPEVREAAGWALYKLPEQAELGAMLEALEDESPAVRRAAAWALGSSRAEPAVAPLILALTDADAAVREAAAGALELHGSEGAAELARMLSQALTGSREAMRELAATQDPRALDPLVLALRDADGGVRRSAALSLGEIGDPRAEGELIELASAWNLRDRVAGLRALLALDRPRISGSLVALWRVLVRPASLAYALGLSLLACGLWWATRGLRPLGRS